MKAGTINILEKPIEEQKKYVKRDAELVMLLAQYKNCIVLRLMRVFSKYSEMDYYKVCHTTVSKWYDTIPISKSMPNNRYFYSGFFDKKTAFMARLIWIGDSHSTFLI